MYWFLLVVVLLFIGFIYNAFEYVKEMIEELNDPVNRPKGISRLVFVIIVLIALLIVFK
jgi:hypothetical protein